LKFMADESVDHQIVERLRQDGHRVWYGAEMDPGIGDQAVLSVATNQRAMFLTAAKDFGALVYRRHP
jgi:predicted nuclease of predicted toxin-antitoxin system